MVVTIIWSYSNTDKMKECKEYWERFGHKVNCPCDPGRKSITLIEKQFEWIEKIEEADLVVAIQKNIHMSSRPKTEYVFEFGESTSYEMAIALRFKKQIVFWQEVIKKWMGMKKQQTLESIVQNVNTTPNQKVRIRVGGAQTLPLTRIHISLYRLKK